MVKIYTFLYHLLCIVVKYIFYEIIIRLLESRYQIISIAELPKIIHIPSLEHCNYLCILEMHMRVLQKISSVSKDIDRLYDTKSLYYEIFCAIRS